MDTSRSAAEARDAADPLAGFRARFAGRGMTVRELPADLDQGLDPAVLAAALDERVSVVVLSAVAYRSGALVDLKAVTRLVHDAGALVLWDLSHAAGAVEVDLAAAG